VTESPIEQVLAALDRLDVDAAVALLAPDVRMLLVDGSRATGSAPARELMASFMAQLRSTAHHITAQWHEDDTWIAEVESSYETRDHLRLESIPRAFVVQASDAGITDLRVYGAHEKNLADRADRGGIWVGGRWLPPL
jgi:hypothetical protein